ncbi:hypothetical protein [Roseivivax sp. CAU 1753]
MTHQDQSTRAALACLMILQGIMLGSLYAGVAPHPPATTPLFGIGPFLGASLSAAAAALILGPVASGAGRVLAGFAALAALVSFGPQKYLDQQFALIWPAVLAGQVAAAAVFLGVLSPSARARRAGARGPEANVG